MVARKIYPSARYDLISAVAGAWSHTNVFACSCESQSACSAAEIEKGAHRG